MSPNTLFIELKHKATYYYTKFLPQPSDVIRISDDTKRGSGKIQTEHS